jgi:hypothetical protein
VDLNNALSAIATNNAGSSEPNTTFAHMLWFDTNNDLMKMRNQANSAWVVVAKKDGSGWTPYRQGTALGTASVQPDNRYVHRTNNLNDIESKSTARANLEIPAPVFLTQTQAVNANSTAFGQVSGQRLAQAVKDNLNAAGSAPMYACRAWVNFNGTGTVAIRASGNVSSITDNGWGDYTVNFRTPMPEANYAATANWTDGSLGREQQDGPAIPVTYGVGSVRILLSTGGGSARGGSIVSVAIFR